MHKSTFAVVVVVVLTGLGVAVYVALRPAPAAAPVATSTTPVADATQASSTPTTTVARDASAVTGNEPTAKPTISAVPAYLRKLCRLVAFAFGPTKEVFMCKKLTVRDARALERLVEARRAWEQAKQARVASSPSSKKRKKRDREQGIGPVSHKAT